MKFAGFLVLAAMFISVVLNMGFIIAVGILMAYAAMLVSTSVRDCFKRTYKRRRR